MIQGKFQLLNCYLIKNIAKAQIYRCTVNYIFLSTYSSYYHLCTTLISSVFVVLQNAVLFLYSVDSISKRKTKSKPSFGNNSAIVNLCVKILSAKQNQMLHMLFLHVPILKQTKTITLEQRRSDRNKNRQQQTVNSLLGKL